MTGETLAYLIPEFVLIGMATLIYIVGAFPSTTQNVQPGRITWLLGIIGFAAAACFLASPVSASPAPGTLSPDGLALYLRWLALAVGALLMLMSARATPGPEVLGTLMMAIAGSMIVSCAGELVLLFLGLELVSIPTYILLYLGRRDAASQESAVKYFFLSILSSAVLLYGFSFLYGVAGSTSLAALQTVLSGPASEVGGGRLIALVGMILVFAGLGFRIAAVPFHFYAPDVFQGTTNVNAALLSIIPKLVGFAALVRIVSIAMPGLELFGWRMALILAILTMTVGNVLALWQNDLRRMMAYSSIAHAGYMLIGITVAFARVGNADAVAFDGVAAVLFYLVVYAMATIGLFAALTYLGTSERQVNDVDELAGLVRTHPATAIAMAVFLFSLAGIPPLAGFWGKFTLFSGAVQSALAVDVTSNPNAVMVRNWLLGLTVIGALNAAIAAAYYLRLISTMYFRPSISVLKGQGGLGPAVAMFVALIAVIAVGAYPVPLVRDSGDASQSAYAAAVQVEPAPTLSLVAEKP